MTRDRDPCPMVDAAAQAATLKVYTNCGEAQDTPTVYKNTPFAATLKVDATFCLDCGSTLKAHRRMRTGLTNGTTPCDSTWHDEPAPAAASLAPTLQSHARGVQQMSKLKECHSCGHATAPKIVRASDVFECNCCGEFDDSSGDAFAVMCDAHKPNGPGGCGASSGFYGTFFEAIDAWNTRATDPRIAELEAENARLRIGYERYETARRMNARQWSDAMSLNFSTGKPFDEIIDDLKPFRTGK